MIEFLRFNEQARRSILGATKTFAEAARSLSCTSEAIGRLITLGLLKEKPTLAGARITEESIESFNREYVGVTVIAKALGTSPFGLVRICDRSRISLLVARRRSGKARNLFLLRKDAQRLPLPSGAERFLRQALFLPFTSVSSYA